MKLELTDELIIKWGNGTMKARVANGLDNITNSEDKIKVILEGDNSYNPVTINTRNIISVNGKGV